MERQAGRITSYDKRISFAPHLYFFLVNVVPIRKTELKTFWFRIREELRETRMIDVDSLQCFARVASRDKPCSEKMTRRAG